MDNNNDFDGLKEVTNLVNNPYARVGLQHARSMLGERFKVDGLTGKIFNPEIRSYFDVDTPLVKKKLAKILFPFKEYEYEQFLNNQLIRQEIKKLQLYIPIVSLMTLIMFSTILKGMTTEEFQPNLMRKTVWIVIFTVAEVLLAKGTENSISNLNISILELCSLVSYRFVSLSVVAVAIVVTGMSVPYLHLVGIIYVFLVDTYYVKIELSNYAKQKFTQEGMGSKIALVAHIFVTLVIIWLSDLM